MALNHSPSIITNGLVLYLDAANPRSYPGSGNTWFDLSGSGNSGTLINGASVVSNQGVVIDNTDDYVLVGGSSFSSLSNATISFFIKTSKEGCIAISFQDGTSINNMWYIGIGQNISSALTNELITIVRTSGSTLSITNLVGYTTSNRSELLDNKWHQVSVTCGSVYNIFLDGNLVPSTQGSNNGAFLSGMFTPVNSLYIGSYRAGTNFATINGQMDNILLYNRELSAIEIQQNFYTLRGKFGI